MTTTWQASFTRLQDSTRDHWQRLMPFELTFAQALPERVLAHLQLLDGDAGGFPVNRYTHSLLAATLAAEDGRDDEYVVCALLHDIGDTLGSYNHPDIAAAILEPFVDEANLWMVKHHGVVQGHHFFHHVGMDRDLRERLRDEPHYERTLDFVERYDNLAFDRTASVPPLAHFAPLLRKVMAAPRRSIYLDALPVTVPR